MSSPRHPILVVGHLGLLGRELMRQLGAQAAGVDREECDILDPGQINRVLESLQPTAIVNCAAYTAVDQAETDEAAARAINADGVENLARAARDRGLHFITISTDYVFTGEGSAPWPEDAPPEAFGPQSAYGRTKLDGERRLQALGGDWCIARTQWLYGAGGKNFIDTIAQLARQRESLRVVADQVGAPTWARDLAQALCLLLRRRATGCYHTINSGFASWCAVAEFVISHLGLACRIEPCASEEYPRPARRPHNSRLDQSRYAALAGQPLRPWTQALAEYLDSTHGQCGQ